MFAVRCLFMHSQIPASLVIVRVSLAGESIEPTLPSGRTRFVKERQGDVLGYVEWRLGRLRSNGSESMKIRFPPGGSIPAVS